MTHANMKRYHLLNNDIDISILGGIDNTRVRWGQRSNDTYPGLRWIKPKPMECLRKAHGKFDLRLAVDLSDEHIVLLRLQDKYICEIEEHQLSIKLRRGFNK